MNNKQIKTDKNKKTFKCPICDKRAFDARTTTNGLVEVQLKCLSLP